MPDRPHGGSHLATPIAIVLAGALIGVGVYLGLRESRVPPTPAATPSAVMTGDEVARAADAALRAHRPAIHVNQGRLREGIVTINPLALADRDLVPLGQALGGILQD